MYSSNSSHITIREEIANFLVKALEDAVGDDIKEDIISHKLITQNSTGSRIWDFLNTNIVLNSEQYGCMTIISKRGPWEMLVLYDPSSKCVVTLMREKRFDEIKRKKGKRKSLHYLDAFSRCLNGDLLASGKQQSLFEPDPKQNIYDEAYAIVQKMMASFSSTCVIEHHVLLLFESVNFQLTGVRAVMIDSDLDTVYEQDWSKYISASESIVADKIVMDDAAYNNPTRGLKLTAKATERQATHSTIKEQIQSSENQI